MKVESKIIRQNNFEPIQVILTFESLEEVEYIKAIGYLNNSIPKVAGGGSKKDIHEKVFRDLREQLTSLTKKDYQ